MDGAAAGHDSDNDVQDGDASQRQDATRETSKLTDSDRGHRYGNFHNYYSFHPTGSRLDMMSEIFGVIGGTTSVSKRQKLSADGSLPKFRYCDLGCNEGDLTIDVARSLQECTRRRIEFEGIDIDPVLVSRASKKWTNTETVAGSFRAADVCEAIKEMDDRSFDLISLLSTTMWIHVHAGDAGLERLLLQMCDKAKHFILIEPQPSKW